MTFSISYAWIKSYVDALFLNFFDKLAIRVISSINNDWFDIIFDKF